MTVLTVGAAAFAEPGAPAANVARFAWPDGVLGSMTYSRSSKRSGRSTPVIRMTYRMAVRRSHDVAKIITWSQPTLDGIQEGSRLDLLVLIGAAVPPILIDAETAEYVDPGPGAIETVLQSFVSATGKPLTSPARDVALSLLKVRGRNFWRALVGRWVSMRLSPGSTSRRKGPLELPTTLPPMTGTSTLTVSHFEPCPNNGHARCVEIDETTDVPPADFVAMTRTASTKLGSTPTELPKEARITRVSFRFHLVTDPATLLPYSMRTEAESKGLYGGKEPIEEGETEEWTFSYDAK